MLLHGTQLALFNNYKKCYCELTTQNRTEEDLHFVFNTFAATPRALSSSAATLTRRHTPCSRWAVAPRLAWIIQAERESLYLTAYLTCQEGAADTEQKASASISSFVPDKKGDKFISLQCSPHCQPSIFYLAVFFSPPPLRSPRVPHLSSLLFC